MKPLSTNTFHGISIVAYAGVFAGAMLLAWSGPAAAQVYKWIDKEGKTHYGAFPPADKGKPLTIAPSASANPAAGVEVPPSVIRHYPVYGDSAYTLHLSMMQNGPFNEIVQQRVYAEIEWRYQWKFDYNAEGGQCRIRQFVITLVTTITMPQWMNAQEAPPAIRVLWPKAVANIRKHEDGHKAIGIEGANVLARRLKALPPFDNCATLTREVNREGERVYAEYALANRAFDRTEALKNSPFDQ